VSRQAAGNEALSDIHAKYAGRPGAEQEPYHESICDVGDLASGARRRVVQLLPVDDQIAVLRMAQVRVRQDALLLPLFVVVLDLRAQQQGSQQAHMRPRSCQDSALNTNWMADPERSALAA